MTEKINNISQIIRSTEEYSDVCDMCRDEILLYPTISGRTEYTQDEVEQITLKRIIDKLRAKELECKNLKEELRASRAGIKDISKENTEICKISEKYKRALDEIEEYTRKQFCDNCEDIGSTEYSYHCEYCEYQEYFDIISKTEE